MIPPYKNSEERRQHYERYVRHIEQIKEHADWARFKRGLSLVFKVACGIVWVAWMFDVSVPHIDRLFAGIALAAVFAHLAAIQGELALMTAHDGTVEHLLYMLVKAPSPEKDQNAG